MGIARTLMYNGTLSEPLYSLLPDGNVSSGEEITFVGQSGEYIKVRETEKESSNGFFNNVWNWIKGLFGF